VRCTVSGPPEKIVAEAQRIAHEVLVKTFASFVIPGCLDEVPDDVKTDMNPTKLYLHLKNRHPNLSGDCYMTSFEIVSLFNETEFKDCAHIVAGSTDPSSKPHHTAVIIPYEDKQEHESGFVLVDVGFHAPYPLVYRMPLLPNPKTPMSMQRRSFLSPQISNSDLKHYELQLYIEDSHYLQPRSAPATPSLAGQHSPATTSTSLASSEPLQSSTQQPSEKAAFLILFNSKRQPTANDFNSPKAKCFFRLVAVRKKQLYKLMVNPDDLDYSMRSRDIHGQTIAEIRVSKDKSMVYHSGKNFPDSLKPTSSRVENGRLPKDLLEKFDKERVHYARLFNMPPEGWDAAIKCLCAAVAKWQQTPSGNDTVAKQ
jgi:hypothetical protein